MKWRIIEVSDEEATDDDLNSSELVSLSIAVLNIARKTKYDNYYSAWLKLRPQVKVALDGCDEGIQP